LFVANSRHLVLARIKYQLSVFNKNSTLKSPKISYKIPESAVSGTLLISGFQIFAADAACQNRAPRDLFTHPTKKNAFVIPRFLPESLGPVAVQGDTLRPPKQLNDARDGMAQTRLPEVAVGGHVSLLVAECQNSGGPALEAEKTLRCQV